MAVDDSDERGPWMKVQAGAFMRARPRRVGLVDAGVVEGLGHHRRQEGSVAPGRSMTAIGKGHGDLPPALPAVEVAEIVGAHDPDEIDARIAAP